MKAQMILASMMFVWCSSPTQAPGTTPADGCALACANLRKLGCPEADTTESGATCEEFCHNAPDLPVDCMAKAASCDAAENCE